MADHVIAFIIRIIYLHLLANGLTNDLTRECIDTREDCSRIITMCYEQFIQSGCKRSCGLCSDTWKAPDVKLKPQIALHSIHETGKYMKVINVSCTLLNYSHMDALLDFKCYSSKSHFQNITGTNKTLSTQSLEIHVPRSLVSINCSCTVLLYYDGQVTNLTTTEQLFVQLQEKPAFYITSSTENGTNITVNENETVSFTCLAKDKNQILTLLNWSDGQIIKPTSQAKFYIDNKTLYSSQSYIITHVQCKDAGVYHCSAIGFHGAVRSTVELFAKRLDICGEYVDCRANFGNITQLCSETTSRDNELNSGQGKSSVSIVPIAGSIASVIVILLAVFAASKSIRGTELEPKPITHLFASVNEYDIQSLNSEPNVLPNGNVYKSSQLNTRMQSIVEISSDDHPSSEGLFYAHLDFSNALPKANCPLLPLEVTEYGDIDFRTNLPAIDKETF